MSRRHCNTDALLPGPVSSQVPLHSDTHNRDMCHIDAHLALLSSYLACYALPLAGFHHSLYQRQLSFLILYDHRRTKPETAVLRSIVWVSGSISVKDLPILSKILSQV